MTGRYADLEWWRLRTPTVHGRVVLDCHYQSRRHRAVVIPRGTLMVCSGGCRRRLTGFGWADLDRTVVLCGSCHARAHGPDDELRELAVDVEPTPQIPGQLRIVE